MDNRRRAWVIMDNGKVGGVSNTGGEARRYVRDNLINLDYQGARFRWTKTHKLFAQAPYKGWGWTGIEIVPAPIV